MNQPNEKQGANEEELYEQAVEAITKLFGDRSVSQATCRDNLLSLKDEIDVMLDSLEEK